MNPENIRCVVFDFGYTLSPDHYFKVSPPGILDWQAVIQKVIFGEPEIIIPWMKGELTSLDIAGILSKHFALDIPTIAETMEKGCQNMNLNASDLGLRGCPESCWAEDRIGDG